MKTKKKFFPITILSAAFMLLSGCLYDAPPSQPSSQIDTCLLGSWITQDKSGKIFEATITPTDNLHYHVLFHNKDQSKDSSWEFEGWISRVDNIRLLTLRSLTSNPLYQNKYLFLHYELMTPEKDPIHQAGIGRRRIRIMEPELPSSALHFDSYHLRQAIRKQLDQGVLLLPSNTPLGFSIWTQIGEQITWPTHYPSQKSGRQFQ